MNVKPFFKPVGLLALSAALLLLPVKGALPLGTADAAAGTVYYVDAAGGSDGNSGTSESSPWKSLSKVTASGSLFRPGDRILLKSGSVWNEPLDITFSGDASGQITVGKYGGEEKPLVNGGGGNYAVRIANEQYVTVQDLELTNFNAANYDDYQEAYYRRSGVWVQAFHEGVMNNIRLKDLDIHDVTGISVTGETFVTDTQGESVNKNHNAAIMANAWEFEDNVPADKHAYFNDLLVEDCYIHDIKTIGISVDGYQPDHTTFHKHLVIRNNTIARTGSDGIIVGVADNPLIEHNAAYDVAVNSVDGKWIAGMWVWKTYGATFQNNEVARVHYKTSSSADSAAFDVDILTEGDHLFQYNYAHDNAGGFAMDMGQLKNGKTTYRYNISQNDAHKGFTGYTMNITDPADYYNNVFYNDNGDGFTIKNNPQATFTNNIFYTSKGNLPLPQGPSFYSNDFFGTTPPSQGLNNLNADPKFVDPGTGGDGIGTTGGYMLKPDSPLIGAGRIVDGSGGKDFWGNPLYTGSPDIGAYEAPDSTVSDTTPPAKPTGLTAADTTDTTVTLTWDYTENDVPLDADVYSAADDSKIGSVVMGGSYTVTGLQPDTGYSFYVKTKDASGNSSPASDPVTVRTTVAATVLDNGDAVTSGSWTAKSGSSSYNDDYASIAAGSGANSVTWTPDLPKDGYYSVYCWLPDGAAGSASNAPFTVHFDGGSKTYAVNERSGGGGWVLLGMHTFKAGSSGFIRLTDQADGEVAADAVKFQYNDGFGLDRLTDVMLAADDLQLAIGGTMGMFVTGKDAAGKTVDLIAEGQQIEYASDSPAAAVSADGIITGISQGSANISATVTIDGKTLHSNSVQIFVGPGLRVLQPAVTDSYGDALTAFTPYGVAQTSVMIVNSTDRQQGVTLIAALYNEKGLVKSGTQQAVVASGNHAVVTSSIVMPGQVEGTYLKIFVWDGTGTMHPLAARTIYPD